MSKKKAMFFKGASGGGSDADADAFIAAVGTLDVTQENAITDLVIGLKANGTWTKYHAIYPFIGGTALAHKWNLKNPLDTDVAFRMTFNGTITHDVDGLYSDGFTGYADTHLTQDAINTFNSSFSIYSYTQINNLGTDWGVRAISGNNRASLNISYSGNLYSQIGEFNLNKITNTSSAGFYTSSRTNNSEFKVFKNGVQFGGTVTSTVTEITGTTTMSICAINTGASGGQEFSDRHYQFFSMGEGLTETEMANDYTVIQAYQTALGRQV